jgi:hypothetical protein
MTLRTTLKFKVALCLSESTSHSQSKIDLPRRAATSKGQSHGEPEYFYTSMFECPSHDHDGLLLLLPQAVSDEVG